MYPLSYSIFYVRALKTPHIRTPAHPPPTLSLLNRTAGECTHAKCVCDPWFTGNHCTHLNLQRPDNMQQGTCGHDFDSYYSWGGRALQAPGESAEQWHLYASIMCNHKTLSSWTTDSSSAHFVGNSSTGPFACKDQPSHPHPCDG